MDDRRPNLRTPSSEDLQGRAIGVPNQSDHSDFVLAAPES